MVLCALAEVLFDIDKGHQCLAVFPPGLFTEQELSDIAFNAFPVRSSMNPDSRALQQLSGNRRAPLAPRHSFAAACKAIG